MSEKHPSIVPHVLYVAEQRHPWRLAPYERLVVRYHTSTTVSMMFGTVDGVVRPQASKKGVTKQQYHVWCLVNDRAWERAQAVRAALQHALDALADELRHLGRYADRLAEAGGVKQATNPLTPTVISVDDPDGPAGYFVSRPVPRIDRRRVNSHTPKMLRCQSSYNPNIETPHNQSDHFVCPDDAAWERIEALHQAAEEAAGEWERLKRELGTYQAALADGRYRRLTAADAHVYQRGDGQYQAVLPDGGRATATTAANAREAIGATLEADPAPNMEEPMTTTTAHTGIWHNLPPLLAGWQWDGQQTSSAYPPIAKLRAPDGWMTSEYEQSNHAIAEALRHVHSQPPIEEEPAAQALTVVEPTNTEAAPVLTPRLQDLARQFLAAMRISGEKLLEASSYVAEAHERAAHGEWRIWLEATGTSEAGAEQLLNIYTRASADDAFADAIKRNFLSRSTAALLARPSTPPEVVERALSGPTPPTVNQVRQEIAASRPAKPDTYQVLDQPPTDDAPKTDASRVSAIQRYLEQQRTAGRVYTTEAHNTAHNMASDIHDGDTWRATIKEIQDATNGGRGAPAPSICEDCGGPVPGAALGARICGACAAKKAAPPAVNDLVDRAATEILTANRDNAAWLAEKMVGEHIHVRAYARNMLAKRLEACDKVLLRLLAQALYREHRLVDVWGDALWRLRVFVADRLFEELLGADEARALRMFGRPAPAESEPPMLLGLVEELVGGVEERLRSGALNGEELADLRAAGRDLDDVVDSLDDAVYEALAARISACERSLRERQEVTA